MNSFASRVTKTFTLARSLSTVLSLSLLLSSTLAFAAPILDFGTGSAGSGGTITVSGSTISGSGIELAILNAIDTPSNDGPYALTGAAGGFAALSFSNAPAGNFFRIVGGVTGGGSFPSIPNGTTLVEGTINIATGPTPSGANFLFTVEGLDFKNEALLDAFGLASLTTIPFQFGGFVIASLTSTSPDGGVRTYTAFSTDVANTPTPEPSSLLLIGSGLLGAAWLRRRQKKS